MRTTLCTFILLAFAVTTFAQDNGTSKPELELNIMTAPASPAASILGVSPAQIDKPREASEFLASVIQNTGQFNQLPGSYAVEFAPAWMFASKNIQHKDFIGNKVKHNMWQGLTLSAAMQKGELETATGSIDNTQVSFGLKTSLLRGKGLDTETQRVVNQAQARLDNLNKKLFKYLQSDEEYLTLGEAWGESKSKEDSVKFFSYRETKYAEFEAEEIKELETLLKKVRYQRTGFKLDLAAGLINDFPGNLQDDRRLSKGAVWLNAGFDGKKGLTGLGMARYVVQPDAIYVDSLGDFFTQNLSNFDIGGRLLYAPVNERFTLSAEAIFRTFSGTEVLPDNWRWVLQAEYQVMPNLSFNFTYGRDHEGLISRDGNVIALVSLFTGLGNSKPAVATGQR